MLSEGSSSMLESAVAAAAGSPVPSPRDAGSNAAASEATGAGVGEQGKSLGTTRQPSEESLVGDELWSDGDLRSNLLFAYGVPKVIDSRGTRLPIEQALGEKVVGLLFTRKTVKDPISRDIPFTERLHELAKTHADEFAVVYVSQDESEEDLMEYLAKRPSFYALAFEDRATADTLVETLDVYKSMMPTLAIMDKAGMNITTWGRSAVLWNPRTCFYEWKEGRPGITMTQLLLNRFFYF